MHARARCGHAGPGPGRRHKDQQGQELHHGPGQPAVQSRRQGLPPVRAGSKRTAGRGRQLRRRRAVVTGGGGAVLVGGFTLAAIGLGGEGTTTAAHSSLPPATASIERTTLVETQQADGTLGFGTTHTATSGGGRGALTWVAAPGTEVTRGRSAYRVGG